MRFDQSFLDDLKGHDGIPDVLAGMLDAWGGNGNGDKFKARVPWREDEHPSLHLFASLTNGHGVAEGAVRVVKSDTDEVLTELGGPLEFPDPMAVVELDFALHDLVFPAEGEYRFQLLCNGELLGERRFVVVVDPGLLGPQEPDQGQAAE